MAIVSRDIFSRSARRLPLVAAVVICALVCTSGEMQGGPTTAVSKPQTVCATTFPRAGDEIWVVSCRCPGCDSPEQAALRMKYWRLETGRWAASSRETFVAQPADMTTSFFVVGNDYSHAETLETGWFAYRRLVSQAADYPPLRFVIWSWPSDRVPGRRLNDAKLKLARTPATSFYLAWLVDQLPAETPISMSGSSFGARINMGALELLAGGRVGRYRLAERADRHPRHINVVLMGAAFDNDDLLPGEPFGRSLSQANRVLLFVNDSDRALRFYEYLFGRRSGYEAIGVNGLVATYRLGADADKVETRDASSYVGPQHGAKPYFQSPALVRLMQPYLLAPPAESQVIEALSQ